MIEIVKTLLVQDILKTCLGCQIFLQKLSPHWVKSQVLLSLYPAL